MDIKEIALKVAGEIYDVNFDEHKPSGKRLISFAEALVAEIAKQNEPVAWMYPNETALSEHETDGPVVKERIPLYTIPPTAEQIANETAEACAKYVNRFINGDGILNEVWISEIESALRNGEWRNVQLRVMPS